VYNGTDAMGFHDTPYEESDTSCGSYDGFQSEKVATRTYLALSKLMQESG